MSFFYFYFPTRLVEVKNCFTYCVSSYAVKELDTNGNSFRCWYNDFYHYFIIVRYKKIGYNINVMRQTACLVVNPIKVNSFAYLFNCTTVGRTSD